jgi:hypothetical protein
LQRLGGLHPGGSATNITPAVLKRKPSAKPQRHDLPRRAASLAARMPVAVQASGPKQN